MNRLVEGLEDLTEAENLHDYIQWGRKGGSEGGNE